MLDNAKTVEAKYAVALEQSLAELQARFAEREAELGDLKTERMQAARDAAQSLAAYQARAVEYVRFAMGACVILLLGAACILLMVGVVRLVSGLSNSRAYLVGSLTSLVLCLVAGLAAVRGSGGWGDALASSRLEHVAQFDDILSKPLFAAQPTMQQRIDGTAPSLLVSTGRGGAHRTATEVAPLSWGLLSYRDDTNSGGHGGKNSARLATISKPSANSIPASARREEKIMNTPLTVREYAYLGSQETQDQTPDTLLWYPLLSTIDGSAEVTFDLPRTGGTYQVRVEGHSSSGRLGAGQMSVPVSPPK
jgi:hypothetical protein